MVNSKGEFTLDNLAQFQASCDSHWESTWIPYRDFFENKTCVDIGIWKGILNAKANKYFFADAQKITLLDDMFSALIQEGNSVGAKLGVRIENCPVGLGEPVFDKLDADLAKAIMSINAVKSVSIGNVDDILDLKGSEIRDEIRSDGFVSNNAGGILGGISNGDLINIEFLIKPTSSIKAKGQSINSSGEEVAIEVTGRHDPCVGLRAVPIAEAMSNLVIMDHFLRNRGQCGGVEQSLPFTK